MLVYASGQFMHGATELPVFIVVALCTAWIDDAVDVSHGGDQHLGIGWCVTVSQTPAEFCL